MLSISTLTNVPRKLADAVEREMRNGEAQVNILDLLYGTAVESIGQAGLGYPFHSLDESRSNAYSDSVRNFS